MTSLLMLSPAPLAEVVAGEVVLDVKFVEGMKLHSLLWPGKLRCVLWRGPHRIDEPMRYSLAQLGFELIILDHGAPVPDLLLDEAALVYCSADDMKHLDLPQAMSGRFGKLVYTIEQSLSGRMASGIAQQAKLRRRIGSAVFNLRHERRLRRALAQADGIHCNGYPAARAYQRLNGNPLRYLDNRMRTPMLARRSEHQIRTRRVLSGAPLRFLWYGALTPESRVLDYLPIACLMAQRGLPFELEIIGSGPLAGRLQDGISALGLGAQMRLLPPQPFDVNLIPRMRQRADIFLSTRRLPTPLSSYVEALGCGLPILGVRNAMWSRLHAASNAGWLVGRGGAGAMLRAIERLHEDRGAVVKASQNAVDFARAHSFETVFAQRMTHLRALVHADD